jgi:hypothetical protein
MGKVGLRSCKNTYLCGIKMRTHACHYNGSPTDLSGRAKCLAGQIKLADDSAPHNVSAWVTPLSPANSSTRTRISPLIN